MILSLIAEVIASFPRYPKDIFLKALTVCLRWTKTKGRDENIVVVLKWSFRKSSRPLILDQYKNHISHWWLKPLLMFSDRGGEPGSWKTWKYFIWKISPESSAISYLTSNFCVQLVLWFALCYFWKRRIYRGLYQTQVLNTLAELKYCSLQCILQCWPELLITWGWSFQWHLFQRKLEQRTVSHIRNWL